ncbi:SAVMC3_10250 family protein [Streptomyces sp. NPDC059582]|uniref:SAVMC3_10250 family protein n=1 Tax=Streptomyces sp. NPDC059582 TaxID=3346875 RepID=UPI00369F83EC
MQELIYLSDAKLRQFVPERRRRTRIGRRLTALRLNASALAVGGSLELDLAEVSAASGSRERLPDVIKTIEEHALWYQDPDVQTGRWVYFEAPFNVAGANGQIYKTVLFMDAPAASGDEQTHLSGVRLLLHGSPDHLLRPVPETDIVVYGVSGSLLSSLIHEVVEDPLPNADNINAPHAPREPLRDVRRGVCRALDVSNRFPEGAAWMRGYARVTLAVGPDPARQVPYAQVLATPLYVEYAHDLP